MAEKTDPGIEPPRDNGPSESPRRPLLQRAAIHALKVLVRRHPRAALSAATAGASYAIKDVAAQGSRRIRVVWQRTRRAVTPGREPAASENDVVENPGGPRLSHAATVQPALQLSKREREEFVEQLDEEEREALATLARETEQKSGQKDDDRAQQGNEKRSGRR